MGRSGRKKNLSNNLSNNGKGNLSNSSRDAHAAATEKPSLDTNSSDNESHQGDPLSKTALGLPPHQADLFADPPAQAPVIGSKSRKNRNTSRPVIPGLEAPSQTTQKAGASSAGKKGSPVLKVANLEEQPANFIPEDVSIRMVRRVVVFCGIPTFLGLSSFGLNLYLITHDVVALPSYFTLVETAVLFGLGFVGITYGVLSASWDTEPGSLLGFREFSTNLGNMKSQWQSQSRLKQADRHEDK
ncbi:MAG: DUF3464 family protein [Synechococcaceae cyanobacterium SM2_3_2]|nr:DUF3464 family protein [Synechococcaceae cyanobacterium SM2_3_2]